MPSSTLSVSAGEGCPDDREVGTVSGQARAVKVSSDLQIQVQQALGVRYQGARLSARACLDLALSEWLQGVSAAPPRGEGRIGN